MPTKTTVIPPGATKWNGDIVLTAHGWALTQRFTGKRYSYRAVNASTGVSKYIGHKVRPANEQERAQMLERILTQSQTTPPLCVEGGDAVLPHEALAQTTNDIFERILPEHGYTLRTEQLALAQDILKALSRRSVLLAEAGVGIGKTHAYLITAALVKRGNLNDFWLRGCYPGMAYAAKMPVVVATSSIALQKAIVQDYIPEISRILLERGIIRKPLTCVLRKGKEHYLCDKRLHLLWKQTADTGVKKLLVPLLPSRSGIDLGEMDFLSPYIKRRICVKGRCGVNCGWRDICRYRAFYATAQLDKVDFQICNHNYLLADTLHRANGQKPLIPNYQAVVLDEAHKFLQAARQMYGVSLTSEALPHLAKTIRSFVFQQGQSTAELWRDADKLTSQSERLFYTLHENVPDLPDCEDETERFQTEIDSPALQRLHNLSELIDRLMLRLKASQPLKKYEAPCARTLWELDEAQKQIAAFLQPDSLVYWLEQPTADSDEILLCGIPKRLGDSLHADLWSKGIPIVLTSGTMAAGTDFRYLKRGLGLERISSGKLLETVRPSPFDYKNNVLIYTSNAVPFPDSRDGRYIAAVADELERLILAAHGHTAALFTSYRVMELVYALLQRRGLPFPLFLLGRVD